MKLLHGMFATAAALLVGCSSKSLVTQVAAISSPDSFEWIISVVVQNRSDEVQSLPPRDIIERFSSVRYIPEAEFISYRNRAQGESPITRDSINWSPPFYGHLSPNEVRSYRLNWTPDRSAAGKGVLFVTLPELSLAELESPPIEIGEQVRP
jgi:hypothetical protein